MIIPTGNMFRWSCHIHLIVIVLMFIKLCMSACPVNSKTYTNTTHGYEICYWKLEEGDNTFNEMNMFCDFDGGTLALIPSEGALNFLQQELSSLPNHFHLWIGIDDMEIEGTYMNRIGKKQSFLRWAQGDPNGDTTENCVALVNGWLMLDDNCLNPHGAICSIFTEIPTTKAETTTQAETTTHGKTTTNADMSSTTSLPSSTDMSSSTTSESSSASSGTETVDTSTLTSTTTSTETITTTTTHADISTTTESSSSTDASTTVESSSPSNATAGNCSFLCNCNFHNYTEEELKIVLTELRQQLAINKKETAAYKRARTSVIENAPTPRGIGALGIIVLTFVIGLIVSLDLATLMQRYSKKSSKFHKSKPT